MQNESMRLDLSEIRVEPKGMTGLQTSMEINENGLTGFTRPKDGLLEFIYSLTREPKCGLQESERQQGQRRNRRNEYRRFAPISKGARL